jgi:hypothetical protein
VDSFLKKLKEKEIKKLERFYGIKFSKNPEIVVVKDRKGIDKLKNRKTERWIVGWVDKNKVFVLDRNNFEKESSHTYSDKEYSSLVIHELAHCFFNRISNNAENPLWLNEGLAIYLSDQNKFKKKPIKFSNFLRFHNQAGKQIYRESGFIVEELVKKFGKSKLLQLVKSLNKNQDKKSFAKQFKGLYGFNLNYKEINNIKNG